MSRHRMLFAALAVLLAGPATLARQAMPGMDMPMQSAQTMPGMDMPMPPSQAMPADMPGMTPAHGLRQARRQPPAPAPSGTTETLDAGRQIGRRPVARGLGAAPMDAQAMQGMPPMQGGPAPAGARSPDYSDGISGPAMAGMTMLEDASRTMLLADRLEYFNGHDGHGAAADVQAWHGNDADKLWLKIEGEHGTGHLETVRTEALWDHAVASYWDLQLGMRQDSGHGPARSWAAFGVQGLAPYWFDMEATAYLGTSGRTAIRMATEYDLKLTERLVLQPDVELNLYGRDDPQRKLGSGLSDATAALRLRYEFRREFAPYVGVVWTRRFGRTAGIAREDGQRALDRQWVAGIRIWF